MKHMKKVSASKPALGSILDWPLEVKGQMQTFINLLFGLDRTFDPMNVEDFEAGLE